MEMPWILPNESTNEGQEIRDFLGRALKADLDSRRMHLKYTLIHYETTIWFLSNSFLGVRIATDDIPSHWQKMWIRQEADEDGYFLLQLDIIKGQHEEIDEMYLRELWLLTAENDSSLTISRK